MPSAPSVGGAFPASSITPVLILPFDSKATPTATAQELKKRRGKRRPNPFPQSKRHRGRQRRTERGKKKRRSKGDKSNNGKMTTLVTLYTLRRGVGPDGQPALLGPVNQWHYASYAAKRHAFAIARREPDKRGFVTGRARTRWRAGSKREKRNSTAGIPGKCSRR